MTILGSDEIWFTEVCWGINPERGFGSWKRWFWTSHFNFQYFQLLVGHHFCEATLFHRKNHFPGETTIFCRFNHHFLLVQPPFFLVNPPGFGWFTPRISPDPGALFPRCRLVVHHGGAGTAQDAVRAECPQLVAPVLAWSDQPFWAREVEERKLGWVVISSTMIIFFKFSIWLDNVNYGLWYRQDVVKHRMLGITGRSLRNSHRISIIMVSSVGLWLWCGWDYHEISRDI